MIDGDNDPVLIINFIDGAGTTEDCVCEGDTVASTPITQIGGVRPTSGGEFSIIGSDCMQIEPLEHGIKLVNSCAKACCSCPELEKITADLERLKVESVTADDYVTRLGTSIETFSLTVLGARLGDRGCITCE